MLDEAISHMLNVAQNDTWLVHRGRYVNVTFLIDAGTAQWLVTIEEGCIKSAIKGPFVMPRWTFALRARTGDWERFCDPAMPPSFHDLMAMVKHRTLVLEGDQHPFMANLLYFKDLIGNMRQSLEVSK
ncbi:hypothetical protein [Paraburkholderia xenovorans]